jgi:hypothetical protein
MNRLAWKLLVALVVFGPCTELLAQPVDTAKFQAFVKSTTYSLLLGQALQAVSPVVFNRCATNVFGSIKVVYLGPIVFETDGTLKAGEWKQEIPVSGCGSDTVLNFYVSMINKAMNIAIGTAGTTRVDLKSQSGTRKIAESGASRIVKNCQKFEVKTTKFESFGLASPSTRDPGPNAPLRPWWETWTLVGCGQTVDVPLNFVPESLGARVTQPGGVIRR